MNHHLRPPWLLGFMAIVLAYNVATLGRVPAFLNDDDGSYASAAFRFWQTGRPGVPGYRDVVGLERDVWAYGRTAAAVQGVFLHFFGVSIFAGLLPSFLIGIGLVAVTCALGRALWDTATGLLAASLLAASGKFFEACRWARPDILVALYFTSSLWLAGSAPAARPVGRLLLAGLLMGLAGDVHLNGFLLAPLPLLFWLLLQPQPARVRVRCVVGYSAAGCLGVIFWLALHYLPDPDAFWRQAALFGGHTHGVRIAKLGIWGSFRQEVQRYTDWFWSARGHRHLFEGLCVLGGAVWMVLREKQAGRALVATWAGFFGIAWAFMSNPFGWYLILIWPVFALWMARAFLQFPLRLAAQATLLALLAAYLMNLGLWGWKALQDVPLQARFDDLRQRLPPEAPVLGNGAVWFAFWDRDYTDRYYLLFRETEVKLNPASGPTGWLDEQRKRNWRYIVAYGDFRRFLDPTVPLENLAASDVYQAEAADIRQARAFSVDRCSVDQRLEGASDTILVLRVRPGSQQFGVSEIVSGSARRPRGAGR